MKRRLIAAAWIAGATLPLVAATLLLVGCCVLPFHQTVHKVMPVCHMAANVLGGEETPQDDATPPPSRERRMDVRMPATFRLATVASAPRIVAPAPDTHYRSFITHGAARCDRDVGLHVLVETFLI